MGEADGLYLEHSCYNALRECLRIHHEGHEGHKGMRKQGKICVNLCNPWLNLFRVTASTKAQWNIKTLS